MNFDFIRESIPLYVDAGILTLKVSVIGIVLALLVGLVCAAVQQLRIPVLRQIFGFYVELSRNTPLIVQLVFLYYGLPKAGITLDAETCAIVGLAFLGGSYMSEAFRSGFESIEPIQTDSAMALGMTRGQVLGRVLLPQAFAVAMPALTANVIFLIKEVSVVSVIALPDLVFVAKDQIGSDYNTQESLFLLVSAYLVILLPVSLLARLLERRVRFATYGD